MGKKANRIWSVILVIVMLINTLPLGVLAEEYQENAASKTTAANAQPGTDDAYIISEVTENRTEFTKEFVLSNGLHMATVYPQAVHYEEDGQWHEINNTLQISGTDTDAAYTNTAGIWEVKLPQQLTDERGVSITKDGYTLSFFMSGEIRASFDAAMSAAPISLEESGAALILEEAEPVTAQVEEIDLSEAKADAEYPELISEKLQSRLTYADIYTDTDIVYDLTSNQLKESIVIGQYSSTLRGYMYTLDVGSLTPVLAQSGKIELYDETGSNLIMVMPAPYLIDNAGEYCGEVTVELQRKGDSYLLAYLLPQEWLADENRQWPVVLDPVVSATANFSNIKDQNVYSAAWADPEAGVLQCGYSASLGKMRFYVQYVEIPKLTSADVVVSAMAQLYKPYGSGTTASVEVHKVTETWDSMTMQWSNMADYDETIEDFAISKEAGFYRWDVTDIVRGWYEGENTGMMFKNPESVENGGTNSWKQFTSSDYNMYDNTTKPTLIILFRNNNGLESYWDYTSSSAGRAGTGYINNYTGNLVWIRSDIGFGGNRMPVSISHIYNANDSAYNTFGLGKGWRTNFNQRVQQWEMDPNYYVWEDSDGTSHYFPKESSGIYKDEDGLELTLKITNSSTEKYTITDKNGNTSYFDYEGRLIKQENNQLSKSSINITYTSASGYLISKITDGAGRVYNFTYSGDLLSKISYVGSGTNELSYVTFEYSGSKLTTIKDKDGEVSTFTYKDNSADTSKNLIASVTDVDGYKLTYEYSTSEEGKPARVISVKEEDGEADGGTLTIEYAKNQTTFTDYSGNVQIMQFNNFGNTISIQDDQGRAQYNQYAINETDDPDEAAVAAATTEDFPKANQLRLSSKLQNTVGNVLADTSFENSTLWTVTSSAVSRSIVSGTAYRGNKSLKLVRSAAGSAAGVYSTSFSVAAGETYTFSAYVKTGTGSAYLALNDGSATVSSEVLKANSDWTRLEVSYTATAAKTLTARLLTADAGTVYMDCVQVEKAPTASRYNLIQNGDFRDTTFWSSSAGRTTLNKTAAPELSTNVYTMTGNPIATNRIYQTVQVSGSKGDTFVLAGWAKGDSAPLDAYDTNPREFSLIATFNYTDGTAAKSQTIRFNPYTDSSVNWQYAAAPIVAEGAYSSIKIELAYDYNVNVVYFDGIQLYKEEFGNSYTYDKDGNLVSVKDLQSQTTTYEYDKTTNDLITTILPTGAKLTYTYDDCHNVKTATTETGVAYSFAYDAWGNNISVSIANGGSVITSSAVYTTDGNRLDYTTDAAGKITRYGYNADTNVLEWVQYPEDTEATRTEYTYDEMYRIASAEVTSNVGLTLSANYTYVDDLLTRIETQSTTYDFSYGDFALRSNIKIGSRTLASYSYTSRTNYLSALDYGNGDKVQYTYDTQGRVTEQTYEDGDTVTYKYDNSGALAAVTDSATGRTTTYYYDFTDRLMKTVTSGDGYSHSVGYAYDDINNLTALVETINGVERTTAYTYDLDNRVTSVTAGDATTTYSYDGFSRIDEQVTIHGSTTVLTESFEYRNPVSGATTGQVSKLTLDAAGYDVVYSYTYDDNGNILSVSDGTNTTNYAYDSLNQLVREDNQAAGKTWTWTYDRAGNILSRSEYAYTAGALGAVLDTVSYTYGVLEWGDLLTGYDGKTISSDTIGNMTSDGTWDYTWEHGRQLAAMSSGNTIWTFTYNADGLRTMRTNGSTAYSYIYNGSSLSQMTVGSNTLYFAYDAAGTPMSVTYNDTVYYYVTNLQGDVIAILNNSGTAVVQYTYDAWGNILSTSGTMKDTLGAHNPLRYRGYVFDPETGLYYVSSRYYDPEIGRFINADDIDLLGANGDFASLNLFAYCGNNPVSRADSNGHFWNVVIGATVGALASGIATAIDSLTSTGSIDWGAVGISAAVGAVSGGVAATGLGVFVQAGWSAAASAVGSVATDFYERSKNPNAGKITLKEIGEIATRAVGSAAIGFGSSLIGSGAGRAVSMGLESKGATMVLSSKGTAYWTRAQAKNLANQGKALINTARGISSVVGTVFTWPTATALSLNL